jgi:hypothetical protein
LLTAGVYAIPSNATLSGDLTLDANNNPNAVFIFQIAGTLSTDVNSKVILVNGAIASNIYWKVEGLVSMAAGTSMKGTVIANNAAVAIGSGATLEGRALSIGGAVNVTNVLAYTPVVAGSPILTGPAAPVLATTANYALFTANGSLANSGISTIKGDVGTNVGLTTGFDALTVTGAIHPIPDGNTTQCGADLLVAYNTLNLLTADIELLYPAQFGRNLVLTPHTYVMKGSVAFTDSLYLNAMGNVNAVFVIQVNGAFATSTHSKVILMNGTQAKNVYWKVDGAVTINDYSVFRGTIICNNGAVLINTGAIIYGRALTTNGSFGTTAITVLDASDLSTGIFSPQVVNTAKKLTIAPNPFSSYTTVELKDQSGIKNYKLTMYNAMGKEVMNTVIINQTTTLNTSNLHTGLYFYKVMKNDKLIQSGKLISKQ